ncbi:MAG: hypothetical protein C0501_14575 [Isosphaera sp.]|nr:hypothetical protein [Isosphaera sp.]
MTAFEDQARSLFLAALDHPPGGWPEFLDAACGGRTEVRARVEELLRAHLGMGSIHTRPPDTVDLSPADPPGSAVGPYKLLERIGEGGFGVVFLAEQTAPVRRRVALKVLKPGMDTRQVVARFEAERQALALMDHPNIATVLDGGATAAGRPYFVMELVRGVPVTDFCDRERLTPRDRLGLFLQVCAAVQHAHQKGVIHRDIKPNNVLVTVHDVTPVVKVIDFGVAKAVGQDLTDKTVFTGFAQMIGTPLYMSPEQAGGSGLDADTRSDIYSLGVLLYELLTGTTPFDPARFRGVGYDEIRRIIREEEPPKPSTRLSTLGPAAATASANRGTEPRRLSAAVRGDLDWIVMKALEKDRNRRYETAAALAADVQRYLADEPVLARPPAVAYRVRKFVRRNRAAVWLAAVVAAAVLTTVGTAAGLVGWRLRERADGRARTAGAVLAALDESREHQAARRLAQAVEAARRAEAALAAGEAADDLRDRVRDRQRDLDLLVRIEAVHQRKGMIREYFVGERVYGGRGPVAAGRWQQLEDVDVDAELTRAFDEYGVPVGQLDAAEAGRRIRERGAAVEAAAALDDWVVWRRGARPADDGWKHLLAVARAADPDPWRERVRDALAKKDRAALEELAGEDAALALPVASQLLLAEALQNAGAAEPTVAFLRKAQGRQPGEFWFNVRLAQALRGPAGRGNPREAACLYSAALAVRPRNLLAQLGLAGALRDGGDLDEAAAACRRVVETHPDAYLAHHVLAEVLDDRGRYEESLAAGREAIRVSPGQSVAYSNHGVTLVKLKRFEEAVAVLRHAVALDPGSATAHLNLGSALRQLDRTTEAVPVLREARRLRPHDFSTLMNLATALRELGADDAREVYLDAFRRRPPHAQTLLDLGATLLGGGLTDEAVTALRDAIGLDPALADAHATLGDALGAERQWAGAAAAYREAVRLRPDYAQAHHNLGTALVEAGDVDEAVRHHREAVRLRPGSAAFHLSLGIVLCDHQRDYEGAIRAFERAVLLEPDDALAHENLGTALFGKRDYAAAVVVLREAIRLAPGVATGHCKLGNTLAAVRQYDEAVTAYGDAIRRKPDLVEAHVGLARAWAAKRNPREAVAAYRGAARLIPEDAQCQFELAGQLEAANQPDEAEEAFGRAAALWRKRASGPAAGPADRSQLGAVLNNFAMLLTRRGKPAEAARLLEEAVTVQKAAGQSDPGSPRYRAFLRNHYRNLTDAHLALGDHAAAARAAAEPPRLYPDNWEEHFRAVKVLLRCADLARADAGLPEAKRGEAAGGYDRAVRGHVREAVKRAGGDPAALDTLAWFLANAPGFRAPALALELAEQAVELAPRQGEHWTTLGAARYRAGRWKEAVKALDEAVTRPGGGGGQAQFFLAMTHWQLGDKPEARRWYERALPWVEKSKPAADELGFLREEAARLLGVEEKEK